MNLNYKYSPRANSKTNSNSKSIQNTESIANLIKHFWATTNSVVNQKKSSVKSHRNGLVIFSMSSKYKYVL